MYRIRGAENCWRREAGDHVYVRRTRTWRSDYRHTVPANPSRLLVNSTTNGPNNRHAIGYDHQSPRCISRFDSGQTPDVYPSHVTSCANDPSKSLPKSCAFLCLQLHITQTFLILLRTMRKMWESGKQDQIVSKYLPSMPFKFDFYSQLLFVFYFLLIIIDNLS